MVLLSTISTNNNHNISFAIQGNTSMSKQMSFMNKLIDMVLLADERESDKSPSKYMMSR